MNGLTQYPKGTLYNAPERGTTTQTITAETIQAWLISELAQQLHVSADEIDLQEPFDYYGLSSREAVTLSGDLQEWLGRDLSPTLVWEYPNIESLARYLAGEETASSVDLDQQADWGTKTTSEAIAIIGLGCRLPGANDPQAFWQLLRDGQDAIGEVPTERWDLQDNDDARWGGFLQQVEQFDAPFFSISPREAEQMDPQQRLLLEVGWEALEHAGLAANQLAGSQTGVFIGISSHDYSGLQDVPTAYTGTGNAFSIAANRLSYLLDLRGPSWAVDTACSSSLVAVHQAVMSLRQGECSLALAGGVNLILSPYLTMAFSQAGMMAADGRCKTFDASADGYVRGEGCGVVVLKRLSDAQRDGDRILALIRGSAVNQDGRSNGLTAPNALAQQAVIQQALENADVAAADLTYIEAHGTGTSLGDPIEVNSLKEVLIASRSLNEPCFLGSAKTNIGHLEAAAGIAGLIKVVLSLQHGEIPPHLHLKELNPHISLTGTPLSIPTERQPWPEGPRLAGVSSFGFGGTNAHVILEEAPERGRVEGGPTKRPEHLLTLSAKSDQALRELACRYETFLASDDNLSLADVCFTANTGRSHFEHRLTVVAESIEKLKYELSSFLSEEPSTSVIKGQVQYPQPKIAFLFTGQGSQYVGMGQELYETEPIFRDALDRCDEILRAYLSLPLLSVLYAEGGERSLLHQTAYTQPALFALEYALAQLWKSWGIEPDYVCGHSVGEYVAACVAGVFSLEDGLKLVAQRGRLMSALPHASRGEMVSLLVDERRAQKAIAPYHNQVSIAALNGPQSVVISGQREAVLAIAQDLAAEGVKTHNLTVSHAFHSPLMEPMLDAFHDVAERVAYHKPTLRFVSNLTGDVADDEVMRPDYWVRHVREAVRFADGVASLHQQGIDILLEIGPKPTLLGMAGNVLGLNVAMLPTLRENKSDWQQMLSSLGELYVRGVKIDWQAVGGNDQQRKVILPTYPFQRQRYWVEPRQTSRQEAVTASHMADWFASHTIEQLMERVIQKGDFAAGEREIVSKVLKLLSAEHDKQQVAAQVDSMLYEVAWQQQKTPLAVNSPTIPRRWLILADQDSVGEALAKRLRDLGQTVDLLAATASIADVRARLLANAVNGANYPALEGVIYLCGHATRVVNDVTMLMQSQEHYLGTLLRLVQTLAAHPDESPTLWVVTQGAQQLAATDEVSITQTPLWGLGRVINLEYPALWGGLIDLDPTDSPTAMVEALATELLAAKNEVGEDQFLYRAGTRYVARLTRRSLSTSVSNEVRIKAEATYLITGGLGALGLLVAEWLAEQGAKHLLLTGRRGISNETQETVINRLRGKGVTVQVVPVDVADEAAMRQLFATRFSDAHPLCGVIHAAGVNRLKSLRELTWADFVEVMRPKVTGGWLLHQLTQGLPLDFFICYTSGAGIWGGQQQAAYGVANHFLDGLAAYRRRQGLPAMSIAWGPWAGGMTSTKAEVMLQAMGIQTMAPEQGIAIQAALLQRDVTQIVAASIQWTPFKRLYQLARPRRFLSLLFDEPQGTNGKKALPFDAASSSLTSRHAVNGTQAQASLKIQQKLASATDEERCALFVQYLRTATASVLGIRAVEQINPHQGLVGMGLDSLMAIELRRRVLQQLEVDLPVTTYLENRSIVQIVEQIDKIYLISKGHAVSTRSQTASQPVVNGVVHPVKKAKTRRIRGMI